MARVRPFPPPIFFNMCTRGLKKTAGNDDIAAMLEVIVAGVGATIAAFMAVAARLGVRRNAPPPAMRRVTNRGGAYECRTVVPPLRVPWTIAFPKYAPTCAPACESGEIVSAEAVRASRWSARLHLAFRPVYLSISDRRWHAQLYGGCLSSTPRNPSGRTGISGRGHLPNLGGNAMIVVVSRHGASTFEMMVPVSTDALARLARLTSRVLPMCKLAHFGYVDHPYNTDNAWVEAAVFVFAGVFGISPGVPEWCAAYASEPRLDPRSGTTY